MITIDIEREIIARLREALVELLLIEQEEQEGRDPALGRIIERLMDAVLILQLKS
jgi:hypothetical protein